MPTCVIFSECQAPYIPFIADDQDTSHCSGPGDDDVDDRDDSTSDLGLNHYPEFIKQTAQRLPFHGFGCVDDVRSSSHYDDELPMNSDTSC